MAYYIHQFSFYIHILAGSMALAAFWLPMLAKKGSPSHIQYGRFFVNAMYAVSLTGFVMTTLVIIDPVVIRLPGNEMSKESLDNFILKNRLFSGFLFMLSLLVFNAVRQSVAVLRAKSNRAELKQMQYVIPLIFQIVCAAIMAWLGVTYQQVLFQVFAGLCLFNAIGSLRYAFKTSIKQREWLNEHVSAILGAGIGAYTAFFVFGGSRIFKLLVPGDAQILLWILPGIVGTVATIWVNKRVKKQFNIN